MRHVFFGLLAAVLGVGLLTAAPTPAEAQGFSIAIGEPYGHREARRWERSYDRPVYERRDFERRGYYGRPVQAYRTYPRHTRPVYYAAPRCTIRTAREWDGYGWVVRRREICR
jgi:hypothetical protein